MTFHDGAGDAGDYPELVAWAVRRVLSSVQAKRQGR
jgi:hypothetical protein